ncbi:sugar phosphate isomerase/epimerase family protein [Paenibacillus campi]|uniref:sugar phosphate isomerase/epimerase family protein n=1 Tax=Paenibacillus campi TaxID=3106031 RepID=UPI002AFF5FFB|nr:sugar phosphate isomerase/epimerase family protein [Paenibacillus sp. SGZ-1009]
MIRLSVFTVCTPDLTPEQLIQSARDAGIDGIEWRYAAIPADAQDEAPSFWRHNRCSIAPGSAADELTQLRAHCNEYGIQPIALVPYLKCGDLDAAQQAFAAGAQLGVQMLRVGVPSYDGTRHIDELQQEAVRYLHAIQDMAASYGIKALIETHHGTIAPSASLALRLVDGLNPQHVGVLYDPGNMVHEGFEHYRMGIELLGPYIAHVHVKNAAWQQQNVQWRCEWAPLHAGIVPWEHILRILLANGYDGYIGIEDFSGQLASNDMLQQFADTFRPLISSSASLTSSSTQLEANS